MAHPDVTPALTDSETLEEVVSCLTEYIPIPTFGDYNQQNIFEIFIRAASQRDSLSNTSKTLTNAPTSNDIRYHIEKYDNLETLESQLNQALQSRLPSKIYQCHQKVAIDLNLIPYYGNPSPEELPYIYRSQAKNGESGAYGVVSLRRQPANPKGTCSFYAYATLYVIKKGKRVTLALQSSSTL